MAEIKLKINYTKNSSFLKMKELFFLFFSLCDLKNGVRDDKTHSAGTDDSHKTGHHETVIQ